MKLKQLTWVTLLAIGALISCSDEVKKPAEKPKNDDVVAALSIPAASLPAEAEKRYQQYIAVKNEAFSRLTPFFLPLQSWQTAIENYQANETGASAKLSHTLLLSPAFAPSANPVIMVGNETINYNEELQKQGILAQISGRFARDESLREFNSDHATLLQTVMTHTSVTTDLLAGDNVRSQMTIAPFEWLENSGVIMKNGGGEIVIRFNEKTLFSHAGALAASINITPTEMSKEGNSIQLGALKGKYQLSDQGDFALRVEPLKLAVKTSDFDEQLEISGLDIHGENVVFDPTIQHYLGKFNGKTGDVIFRDSGVAINYGRLDFNSERKQTAPDSYDWQQTFTFVPNSAAIMEKWQLDLPLDVKTVTVAGNFEHFSSTFYQQMKLFTQSIGVVEQSQYLAKMLADFSPAQAVHYRFTVDAAEGKADVNLKLRARESGFSEQERATIARAIMEGNFATLRQYFVIDGKMVMSQSLAQTLGLTLLLGAQGITAQDGEYHIQLYFDANGLKINDKLLPF